jgi:hypothetical protein
VFDGRLHCLKVYSIEGVFEMETAAPFSSEFWVAMAPETVLLIGLVAVFLIPNLGSSKMRIPLTNVQIPWFLGGRRFKLTGAPHLPGLLGVATLFSAFFLAAWSQFDSGFSEVAIVSGEITLIKIDAFARVFEMIFFGAILLAALASLDRVPATTYEETDELDEMYNNRRQADLYILMLTTALGMSMVALAQEQ